MTICIGALAREVTTEQCIVACADKMVSNDMFGSETQHKLLVLSENFVAMFAGMPSRAKEVEAIYRSYLKGKELRPDSVIPEMERPISLLKRRLADSYCGRELGIQYRELLANKQQWEEDLAAIRRIELGIQLIIAGFIGKEPVLLRSDETGQLEWQEHFSAIGTGEYIAEPWLHRREHDKNTSLERALYNVFEAKRLSEVSPAVGKTITRLFIIRPPTENKKRIRIDVLMPPGEVHLQSLFNRHGPKKLRSIASLPDGSFVRGTFRSPLDEDEED